MNAAQIHEQSASDKGVELLNFNNLVRGVKELLAMRYADSDFIFTNTGTARALALRRSTPDKFGFKVDHAGGGSLKIWPSFWDRNDYVIDDWGTTAPGSSLDATTNEMYIGATITGTFYLGVQIDDGTEVYNEITPTSSMIPVLIDSASMAALAGEDFTYADRIKVIAKIVTDGAGSVPPGGIEQMQFGPIQDHLAVPDTNWARGAAAAISETIEVRPMIGAANEAPTRGVLMLRGAHNDTMVPKGAMRFPVVVRDNNDERPAHVRYAMCDTDYDYPGTPANVRSLEINPLWGKGDDITNPPYIQVRNYDVGSPDVFAVTDRVFVRHVDGSVVDVAWPTISAFIGTGIGGGAGGTGGVWGWGSLVSHHDLADLTTYDDHDDDAMKYLNLGDPNSFLRNTALTGTCMIGGATSIEDDLLVGEDALITGTVSADYGTISHDLLVGDNITAGGTIDAGILLKGTAGTISQDLNVGLKVAAGGDFYQGAHQGATETTGFYIFDATGTVQIGGPYYLRGGIICVD